VAHQQFAYGGQAVIEGVMIRGQRVFAVATRHPSGQIHTVTYPIPQWGRSPWRRVPIVRGVLVLAETLVMGMRALTYSAQVAAGEGHDRPIPAWSMALTILASVAFAVALFFVVPLWLVHALVDRFTSSSLLSNLAEGALRLAVLVGYLVVIGWAPTIRRLFAYHAAEHMTVHTREAGLSLEPANVRKFPAAHPRCGTAFLLTVMLVSIVVFALLGRPELPARVLSRVLLIPVIAGVSYEVIRLSAAHTTNLLVQLLIAPSLALQRLTTRPPDDSQIEVAISAMDTAIQGDQVQATLDP